MTRLTGWVLRRHPAVAVDPDRWREALHPACRSKAIRHDRTPVVLSGRDPEVSAAGAVAHPSQEVPIHPVFRWQPKRGRQHAPPMSLRSTTSMIVQIARNYGSAARSRPRLPPTVCQEYGAGWEPILRSEMLQAARVPPSDPAEAIADPESRAARRGKQRRHASCGAGLSLGRSERLKLQTIETNQTCWAAQPQQAIVRLREGADFRRGSIAGRPRSVI